jgi:hypothetical protein
MVEIALCPECGRPRALGHPCPSCAGTSGQSPYSADKKRRQRGGWSRKSPLRIILALLVFGALCYAFAWGAPYIVHVFNGSPNIASPNQVTRYEDARGSFSFEYPASWVKLPYVSQMENEVIPYAQAAFVDPNGAESNNLGIDFIAVSAIKSPVEFTEEMRTALLPSIQGYMGRMASQVPGLEVTEPPSEFTTGNGLRGVRVGYTASLGGHDVMEELYILPAGTMQYQIVVQAEEKHWQSYKARFDAAVRSFRVLGTS